MYADDTVIYTHGRNVTEVANKLSLALDKIAQWLQNSCLTLNTNKTVTMYFSKKQICGPQLSISGQTINNVKEVKYLGMYLDSTLTFNKHVKHLSKVLKISNANFRHIRNSLNLEASKVFLHAMIFSHLQYCLTCWSQAAKTIRKELERLFKHSLKIFDKRSLSYHHCNILHGYKLLNFDHMIYYSEMRLLFKILHNTAAPPLRELFQFRSDHMTRTSRSSVNSNLIIPLKHSAMGQSSFSFTAVKKWNSLPVELKTCPNYHTFSYGLKQWLLSKQTCQHYH